ncbi:hypothetical protein AB0E59_32830 [Lentzea sp. NPDC034063]|uniref:hypothetical protein n=1 Tax=unclassified Lentzea TaxID=2643253 RepID=UPI0033E719D9
MTQEPEPRNEINGDVQGEAVQAGRIGRDLNYKPHNVHHYHAADREAEPEFDFWLVFAGVVSVVTGIAMIYLGTQDDGGLPLFGLGLSVTLDYLHFLDRSAMGDPDRVFTFGLGIWLIWSALDLFAGKKQARQRDRTTAQAALWTSLLAVYLAAGVPARWIWICLIGFAVGLICLLRGPQVLRPGRRTVAIVAGVIALVVWVVPELHALWGDTAGASVFWQLAGSLLLLVIVAVPVHAVMTAPAANAARVLRAWAFCLGLKLIAATALAMDGERVPDGSVFHSWWFPAAGIAAMLLASSSVRERPSARAA